MANFQQHLLYGVAASSVGAAVGHFQFGLTQTQSGAALILGTVASLSPDLDLPTSVPGETLCELTGLLCPLLLAYSLDEQWRGQLALEHYIVGFTLMYLLARHGMTFLLKHLTKHRGMFHSIPAAIICGELVFLAFVHLSPKTRMVMATIAMIGYLTHLLADEIYAVDWQGNKIKDSFGTAFDLGHWRSPITWLAYGMVLSLLLCIWEQSNGGVTSHLKQLGSMHLGF